MHVRTRRFATCNSRGPSTRSIGLFGIVIFCSGLVSANGASTVGQAIKQAQQTGKPIFAVAGASYCPSCVKLMKTLNTDESLRPYIDQFVPLKINAQSADYKHWKQFFPPKRSAIPALFIVTAQGKELYSAVGALPTKSLQKVMLTSLEKAERYPTKEQWEEIANSIDLAKKSLDDNDLDQASLLLMPMLARLDQMGSLLQLADEGRRLVADIEELAAKQHKSLDKSLQSLVSKGDFTSAMEVATLEKLLTAIPQQRKPVAMAMKKAIRNSDTKTLLRQARELHQAETLSKHVEAKQKRKAVSAFKRIAKRYPNTEAATRAEQQLLTLAK